VDLPNSLIKFYYNQNQIEVIENLSSNLSYFGCNRYHIKNEAAKVIQKAAWNWFNKAICSDNTYGINFGIGIRRLQEDNLVSF
jgi:hypothetical protein